MGRQEKAPSTKRQRNNGPFVPQATLNLIVAQYVTAIVPVCCKSSVRMMRLLSAQLCPEERGSDVVSPLLGRVQGVFFRQSRDDGGGEMEK